ncbi:MAG: hemerythrin domain-containing protein [Rhizobacter sp.]
MTNRHNLYAPIHKALRLFMTDTLVRVGRLDVDDPAEMAATLGQVDALREIAASHLAHENDFVHPAIEARQPGTAERIAGEHVEHLQAIDALGEDLRQLRAADGPARPAAAMRLYRHLALFVADNFQHMHFEETVHNAALWAHYDDAELKALHDRLLASIPPAETMLVLRWMVPALSPAERAGLVGELMAVLPPPALQAVLRTVRPHLDDAGWGKLARAVGIERAAFDAVHASSAVAHA